MLTVSRFMPCLKFIVQQATTQELRMLRGKTIECISLIGLAVGKEKVGSSFGVTHYWPLPERSR